MRKTNSSCSFTAALAICLALASTASGQNDAKKPAKKAAQRPTFVDPEVDSSLPNVLLLGDSISIGYTLPVRKLLTGKANVFRPAANCGPTTNGVENLESWLGDRKWDVIHFNFGLHDLKYMNEKNGLADPQDLQSHQQVPLAQYTSNLKQISERLKKTGAVVIWCETTPVPEGSAGRIPGDELRYNDAAAKVMKELGGIEVNDLHSYVLKNVLDEQRPANVHFTDAGSDLLAKQVAEKIAQRLASK